MKQVSVKKALQAWQGIQPISEKDRERLSRRFTIDYNYNSNHIEGNTLTYGQTEILLLFGKVVGEATVRDVQEMTASNVGLKMMTEEAKIKDMPLTQNFIRTLHQTLLREDYTVYRELPNGVQTSYTIHAGQYKTRPNSVITRYGDRFEYAARIARLMVNFILSRHGLPMIVVRSRKKQDYLEALHQADLIVGKVPSDGAHATINDIAPFVQYFQGIVANEIYHDYLFVTHKDENVWWYDGEMIEFRTPNYAKILRMMQTRPALTQEDMRDELGISLTAVRKLVGQLTEKNYVERNTKDGSWRVIITPSV